MSSLMLVCAVLASLAFGVLVAYGICQAMFRMFRLRAESGEKQPVATGGVRVTVEG